MCGTYMFCFETKQGIVGLQHVLSLKKEEEEEEESKSKTIIDINKWLQIFEAHMQKSQAFIRQKCFKHFK